jgi:hypothetical protein
MTPAVKPIDRTGSSRSVNTHNMLSGAAACSRNHAGTGAVAGRPMSTVVSYANCANARLRRFMNKYRWHKKERGESGVADLERRARAAAFGYLFRTSNAD